LNWVKAANAHVAQYSLSANAGVPQIRAILVPNGDRTANAASTKGTVDCRSPAARREQPYGLARHR
jgi:hypothetical protein